MTSCWSSRKSKRKPILKSVRDCRRGRGVGGARGGVCEEESPPSTYQGGTNGHRSCPSLFRNEQHKRVANDGPRRKQTALKFSDAVATMFRRDPKLFKEFRRSGSRKHPLRRRRRRPTRAVIAPRFPTRSSWCLRNACSSTTSRIPSQGRPLSEKRSATSCTTATFGDEKRARGITDSKRTFRRSATSTWRP
eukprot:IDg21536t1